VTTRWWTWRAALAVGLAAAFALVVAGTAPAQNATGRALADGITVGPDGNIWFTEFNTRKIGRITPTGKIRQFAETVRGAADITSGPDNALWFTEYGDRIGRITTSGKISELPVPFGNYRGITLGPDSRLWFVDKDGDKVLAMTTQGSVSEFQLAKGSTPEEIVAGPDGNMWVTLFSRHGVARVTLDGAITEFLLPSSAGNPAGITVGPDGALWFTESQFPAVGRITTAGVLSEIPLPSVGPGGPTGITVGSDGALWVTNRAANTIGRLTTAGGYTEARLPAGGLPIKIVGLPAAGVWFTENGRDRIGRLLPAATPSGFGALKEFAYDTTPPKAKVTVTAAARASARAGLRSGKNLSLRTRIKCTEACSVVAELLAPKAVAAKLGVSGAGPLVLLGRTSRGPARARTLPVGLNAKISKALARRGPTSLSLRVTARDAQGNGVLVRRSVRV
jgi:streptogramin lyase